ncbi:MAG: hypothetical protein ACRDM1_00515 [Gaiellaceae bacterium]
MTTIDIEKLAHQLAALPPAPAGWVEAAQELPAMRAGLDELLARAERDAELRERLVADLESALAESGLSPTPRLLAEARTRLTGG